MKNFEHVHKDLMSEYSYRYREILVKMAEQLHGHITECLVDQSRIDRISVRAKTVNRFMEKAHLLEGSKLKYSDPLVQIQDQIGARIIVLYRHDVDRIVDFVGKYFSAIENQKLVPESEYEFGYFGRHLVLKIPSDVVDEGLKESEIPSFFELQIKTLFQHAWSEADHDLGYKPGDTPLNSDQKRKIAFTSAQAWGADLIFEELFKERSQ